MPEPSSGPKWEKEQALGRRLPLDAAPGSAPRQPRFSGSHAQAGEPGEPGSWSPVRASWRPDGRSLAGRAELIPKHESLWGKTFKLTSRVHDTGPLTFAVTF